MENQRSVVFIPGLLCNQWLWHHQIEALSAGFQCQIADISQHDNVEAMAQDVLKQAPAQFYVVGFSLGGWVALEISRLAQERLLGVVILCATAGTLKPQRRANFFDAIEQVKAGHFTELITALYPQYVSREHAHDPVFKQALLSMMQQVGPKIALRQLSALAQFSEPFNHLSQLKCPALILDGDEDQRIERDELQVLVDEIPQSQLSILPNSGHFLSLENPVGLNQALSNWLQAK